MCPILGQLIPLFWISSDISSGFQSQSRLPYLHCGGKCNVCSLRSTSGAIPADLLTVSMAASPVHSYFCRIYFQNNLYIMEGLQIISDVIYAKLSGLCFPLMHLFSCIGNLYLFLESIWKEKKITWLEDCVT